MTERVAFSQLANFTEKQREATKLADQHRYFLFGGSRGPGKSYWLRWYCLRFLLRGAAMGYTGMRVMLACENYPALRDRHVDKIVAETPRWLGAWSPGPMEYRIYRRFGGGVICLRNLDDPSKYQSAEFALIAVDELTRNPRSTFDALRGSLRWPGFSETRFIAATNPTGKYADWVRELWIERKFPDEYKHIADEFAFLPALPTDNPHLPDSYLAELKALPEYLRRAWMEGDWYAMVAGNVFRREWFRVVDKAPEGLRWARYWDLAASTKTTADYTASVAGAFGDDGTLYLRDMIRGKWEWPDQERILVQTMLAEPDVVHGIEKALHGIAAVQALQRRQELIGISFRGIDVDKDKLTRALPLGSRAEQGKVVLVRGPWIPAFLDELVAFAGDGSGHDDQVDAASGVVRMLMELAGEAGPLAYLV